MTACSLLLQVISEGSEVEKRKLGLIAPTHLPKELFKCCFGPLCQNGKNNFPEFRRKNIGGLEVYAPLLELGVYDRINLKNWLKRKKQAPHSQWFMSKISSQSRPLSATIRLFACFSHFSHDQGNDVTLGELVKGGFTFEAISLGFAGLKRNRKSGMNGSDLEREWQRHFAEQATRGRTEEGGELAVALTPLSMLPGGLVLPDTAIVEMDTPNLRSVRKTMNLKRKIPGMNEVSPAPR